MRALPRRVPKAIGKRHHAPNQVASGSCFTSFRVTTLVVPRTTSGLSKSSNMRSFSPRWWLNAVGRTDYSDGSLSSHDSPRRHRLRARRSVFMSHANVVVRQRRTAPVAGTGWAMIDASMIPPWRDRTHAVRLDTSVPAHHQCRHRLTSAPSIHERSEARTHHRGAPAVVRHLPGCPDRYRWHGSPDGWPGLRSMKPSSSSRPHEPASIQSGTRVVDDQTCRAASKHDQTASGDCDASRDEPPSTSSGSTTITTHTRLDHIVSFQMAAHGAAGPRSVSAHHAWQRVRGCDTTPCPRRLTDTLPTARRSTAPSSRGAPTSRWASRSRRQGVHRRSRCPRSPPRGEPTLRVDGGPSPCWTPPAVRRCFRPSRRLRLSPPRSVRPPDRRRQRPDGDRPAHRHRVTRDVASARPRHQGPDEQVVVEATRFMIGTSTRRTRPSTTRTS